MCVWESDSSWVTAPPPASQLSVCSLSPSFSLPPLSSLALSTTSAQRTRIAEYARSSLCCVVDACHQCNSFSSWNSLPVQTHAEVAICPHIHTPTNTQRNSSVSLFRSLESSHLVGASRGGSRSPRRTSSLRAASRPSSSSPPHPHPSLRTPYIARRAPARSRTAPRHHIYTHRCAARFLCGFCVSIKWKPSQFCPYPTPLSPTRFSYPHEHALREVRLTHPAKQTSRTRQILLRPPCPFSFSLASSVSRSIA